MSANISETKSGAATEPASAPVPKRITNAQTVCNERNEKNKLCNGHLKQLKTAGEASEVHLRGDDVLFKCHLCGTLYMGPPLGHVRDPDKQTRFVEAELSALLQAAGGTLPVIQKNDKGVYVIVEAAGGHGHAAPAAKPAAAPSAKTPAAVAAKPAPAAPATGVADKATAAPKTLGEPNRELNRRSAYAGVVDTGPVAGETREQKIARLQKVVEGAKKLAEEGGKPESTSAAAAVDSSAEAGAHRPAAEAQAETGAASPVAGAETPADLAPGATVAATTPSATSSQAPLEEPDRNLMTRASYAGVVDTGPIPGETNEQKIERLTKLVEAAKKKAEDGG